MKLTKLAELGGTLGAATLVGLSVLQHNHKEKEKEEEHPKVNLGKLAEVGAALGTLGFEALQHKRKKEEHKKSLFRPSHIVLYSSLAAAGMALWEIKKHHELAA